MDPGPLSVKMVSSGPVMAKNVLVLSKVCPKDQI